MANHLNRSASEKSELKEIKRNIARSFHDFEKTGKQRNIVQKLFGIERKIFQKIIGIQAVIFQKKSGIRCAIFQKKSD